MVKLQLFGAGGRREGNQECAVNQAGDAVKHHVQGNTSAGVSGTTL